MWDSIMGALKGIGSGMGKAFQNEGGEGGFSWDKLMGATQAFGQGMGPESEIGKNMAAVSQGGRSFLQGRAADRAKKGVGQMQAAQANAPDETEEAPPGMGELTPPPMQQPPMPEPVQAQAANNAAAMMAKLTEAGGGAGQMPVLPSLQIPGIEQTPDGYIRRQGQPLMY